MLIDTCVPVAPRTVTLLSAPRPPTGVPTLSPKHLRSNPPADDWLPLMPTVHSGCR